MAPKKHEQQAPSATAGLTGKFTFHVEFWSETFSLLVKLALPIGGAFLLFYCIEYGIPFPTHLSELPTLLIAMAALGFLLVTSLSGFLFIPGMLRSGALGQGYDVLYENPGKGPGRRVLNQVKSMLLVLLIPLFLLWFSTLALIIVPGRWKWFLLLAIVLGGLSLWLGIRQRNASGDDKKKAWVAAAAHILVCFLWMFYVLLVLIKEPFWQQAINELPERLGVIRDLVGLAWMVLAVVVLAGSIVLLGIIDHYSQSARATGKRPFLLWTGLLVLIFAVCLLNPFAASWVARGTLAALGLGGGQLLCYNADLEKMPAEVKKLLNVDADTRRLSIAHQSAIPDGSIERPLSVALDLGSRLFVLPPNRDVSAGSSDTTIELAHEWLRYRRQPVRSESRAPRCETISAYSLPNLSPARGR